MSKPLRIVFAGTPDFAAQTLLSLLDSEHDIIAVYTQPDRRSGRGKKITKSPVKKIAEQNAIDVYQPINFKDTVDLEQLALLKPDLMIIVAYGLILPHKVLDTPVHGCINVHASLLPRWRGASPIERAILAGDRNTGVTIMQMDSGLDTGDMLNSIEVKISDSMTGADLHDKLITVGNQALNKTLRQICDNQLAPIKQDEALANYAHKLHKSEGDIDWCQSSEEINRKIRGLCPRLVAFTHLDDQTIRIWSAELSTDKTPLKPDYSPGTIISADKEGISVVCHNNTVLTILSLQLPGGKQLNVRDIIHSKKALFALGKRFNSTDEKQSGNA